MDKSYLIPNMIRRQFKLKDFICAINYLAAIRESFFF